METKNQIKQINKKKVTDTDKAKMSSIVNTIIQLIKDNHT